MIAIPIATIRTALQTTKGKSGTQIEVERELITLLDKRRTPDITQDELANLYEQAAMECALRDVVTKMRKDGKLPTLHPLKN